MTYVALGADIEAALFDLDGVVTDTAGVHATAWKQVFDSYLAERSGEGEEFERFDVTSDYHRYVDGKPRIDGVQSFLASRGIDLARGDAGDPPERETLHGIGNRKDAEFLRRVGEQGVRPFPSTVALIERLREVGVPVALFTASRNCREVLRSAGLEDAFDAVLDGREAARLRLPGKPDPATLLEAARRLEVDVSRTVVFEDSRAGAEAARRGGFRMVVGVDRGSGPRALSDAGADAVVADLSELELERESPWRLAYRGFEPAEEGLREALCTTGNGYFATRGAAPESRADSVHYPGTYSAEVCNRLSSDIAGKTVENESIVNLPNWLPLTFRIEQGPWFELGAVELLDHEQGLDLRRGVLSRRLRFRDGDGRHTSVAQRRLVSMDAPHLAALQTTIRAEDWAGEFVVRSGLDGDIENGGVERYRDLPGRHLIEVESRSPAPEVIELRARTSQSRVEVVEAARTVVTRGGAPCDCQRRILAGGSSIADELSLRLEHGEEITVEKTVALHTSRDQAISEPTRCAGTSSGNASSCGWTRTCALR